MNREIKFRAWDTVEKKMIENLQDRCGMMADLKCCNHIVMQYTGLKDKKGVEIYEGDIVKIRNSKCQLQIFEAIGRVTERYFAWGVTDLKIIKFENYSPQRNPPNASDIMYFLNMVDCKRIDLLGNIHQHPNCLAA